MKNTKQARTPPKKKTFLLSVYFLPDFFAIGKRD